MVIFRVSSKTAEIEREGRFKFNVVSNIALEVKVAITSHSNNSSLKVF